jgi:hypothetical protein
MGENSLLERVTASLTSASFRRILWRPTDGPGSRRSPGRHPKASPLKPCDRRGPGSSNRSFACGVEKGVSLRGRRISHPATVAPAGSNRSARSGQLLRAKPSVQKVAEKATSERAGEVLGIMGVSQLRPQGEPYEHVYALIGPADKCPNTVEPSRQ